MSEALVNGSVCWFSDIPDELCQICNKRPAAAWKANLISPVSLDALDSVKGLGKLWCQRCMKIEDIERTEAKLRQLDKELAEIPE